tara:strand:- start:1251 stop:1469 length:219 start_codon:yes stop_codon:yes gene_type:complete
MATGAQVFARTTNLVRRFMEAEGIRSTVVRRKLDEASRFERMPIELTDRKFNRMRPSMARVLGLETRSAKEG